MNLTHLYHTRLRVGLLGGSFNPAHGGHRHICLMAMKRLGLDQIWWLVSPHNPLKPLSSLADYGARLRSAKTAAKHPRMRATDLERTLKTRYTIDTVRELKRRFPEIQFFWLMGADNLATLHRWRNWRELAQTVPFVVLDRGIYMHKAVRGKAATVLKSSRTPVSAFATHPAAPAWCYLPIRKHPASSTAIRKKLGKLPVSG